MAGATSGLGLAIARRLAPCARSLSICGRDPNRLDDALSALSEDADAHGQRADVTDRKQLCDWLDGAADRGGGVDVLIANAGGNSAADGWERVFSENVFWVVEALGWAERNLAEGGSVVLLSSVAARLPQLDSSQAAYGAAKASLDHLTAHAAQQLGRRSIRVNAVAPGPVWTPGGFWDQQASHAPGLVRSLEQASALGKLVTAAEVAECVAFLAGPDASGVTGAVLRCDAGFEAAVG